MQSLNLEAGAPAFPGVYHVAQPGGRPPVAVSSIGEFDLAALAALAAALAFGPDRGEYEGPGIGGEFDARTTFIGRAVDQVVPGADDWAAIWTLAGWNRDFLVLPPASLLSGKGLCAAQVARACVREYVVDLYRRNWGRVLEDARRLARGESGGDGGEAGEGGAP